MGGIVSGALTLVNEAGMLRAVSTVYDYIVVGAGSSGAAVAARLSEDADRSVLLLEAGPDYASTDATPHDLRYAHRVSVVDHDWGFTANATPDREVYYPRGRVLGGSSAVNGTLAILGHARGLRRVGGARQRGVVVGGLPAVLPQAGARPRRLG